MSRAILEQMLSQRRHMLDLGGGLKVRLLRAREAEVSDLLRGEKLAACTRYVDGWDGFTGATLLGQGVGSDDTLPFDADLWAAYIADHSEHIGPIVDKLIALVNEHYERKQATSKN